jgi:hypothetical protein
MNSSRAIDKAPPKQVPMSKEPKTVDLRPMRHHRSESNISEASRPRARPQKTFADDIAKHSIAAQVLLPKQDPHSPVSLSRPSLLGGGFAPIASVPT